MSSSQQESKRPPVAVVITGACDGLPELRETLIDHPDCDVLGWAEHVRDASAALSASHLQVVLHGTTGVSLLSKELAAIREHTLAPVILLASREQTELLDAVLEARISDLLLLPQPAESVIFAARKALVARNRRDTRAEGGGRIITVFSPKGGTGKTVIATNMAVVFAEKVKGRVLLVDLDLQFGDAAIMLGIRPTKTLHELVTAPGELDPEKLAGFTIAHSAGFDVLAAPVRPDEAELVTEHKVSQLFSVARRVYDTIVVDTSPFFYGPMLATLDSTDDLLLVSVPEVPTLKNAFLTLRTLELLSFPSERIRVTVNRKNLKAGLSRKDIEETLDHKVQYELPDDIAVQRGLNMGNATVVVERNSDFSRSLTSMVESLAAQDGKPVAVPTK